MMQPTSLDDKSQPTETLFNKIYQIAKTSKTQLIIPELKKILTPDTCLDVRNSQGDTVAGKLAAEGNQAAVKELMKLGANINLIAYGAAQGGHREYAEWLRQHHHANVTWIAEGAARGGHREYAEWLRQHHHADATCVAGGAAQGGHREYAEWLRQHYHADSHTIAQGAAQGGHREYAEWLRHHRADILHYWVTEGAVRGAAQGGHREYAEWLRQHHHVDVRWIARGAAEGGHREYAEWLRQHYHADVHWIALGAAKGGYREYAEWLRRHHHANVNCIAFGAAQGGFQDYIEFLHLNGDSDDVLEFIAPTLNHSKHFDNEKLALRYLAFIHDDRHRVALSHALNAIVPPLPYPILRLLPRARQIQATMQRYGLHYDQALAWTHPEIQTLLLHSSHFALSKQLPEDLILSCSLQLAPLTLADAEKLLEVAKLIRARALLVAELKRYYASSGTFLFGHLGRNSRAHHLAERCATTHDLKTLTLLLDNEIKVPALTKEDIQYQGFLKGSGANFNF